MDKAYGYEAIEACPGGEEDNLDHLDITCECSWCVDTTKALAKEIGEVV